VAGVVASLSPAKPAVEVSFVRYGEDGAAVLSFTNRGQEPVRLYPARLWYFPDSASVQEHQSLWPFIVVVPQGGTQVVARLLPGSQPPLRGEVFYVQCVLLPSNLTFSAKLRACLEVFLSKVGIDTIANTGFVAAVTLPLPPWPAATSSGLTNQNTP
jgi:hypothetical protein